MTGDRQTIHYSRGATRTNAAERTRQTRRPRVPGALEELAGRQVDARECRKGPEPMPIWFAVLAATPCQAKVDGRGHSIRWECVAGRALYTNVGPDNEEIQPLDVRLEGGHTLAVFWAPNETAYSMETYR